MKQSTFAILLATFCVSFLQAQQHPSLILTQKGVEEIRSNRKSSPFFEQHLMAVKAELDAEIASGIDVPLPKDMAGGYTHERHKRNFFMLQKAGVLYQILEDEKYANYVKEMFFAYADMYPSLPIHPQPRSYARGKLFWQCLNDSNWLVYASQAYDCIYDFLSKKERKHLETQLFRPFADYLSVGNPQFFNRIHNHSTWGNAAVGMIGLVMNDQELIDRALYGLKEDGISFQAKDNDGGFIKDKGGAAGFLANIEAPFSPDGYYTEAPYYQRYAMYPYLLFAVGLNNVRPDLGIFDYKDGVLLKAVDALLNLTDSDGEFYPLNDAQKGMSYFSRELVSAVDIAYHYGDQNPGLLSIAKKQGKITLDDAGIAVAKAISEGKSQPFQKSSRLLSDGPKGKQGGIAILREGSREEEINVVAKYSAQGNSHGHYDKLSYSMYLKGNEVLQDYGLARFVNIDQKNGGGYLKENKTWAKQTVAHNTLVVNEKSHFNANYSVGSKFHSDLYFSDLFNSEIQVISAKENNAYAGTQMHRTLFLLNDPRFDYPILIDLFKVTAKQQQNYDLPYHYLGQVMSSTITPQKKATLSALGSGHGYQHLWLRAQGQNEKAVNQLSWLNAGTFFTLTYENQTGDEMLFTQLGANDPEFNLRNDPSFILRRKATESTLFFSVVEAHGSYSPVSEIAKNASSSIREIKTLLDNENYTVVQISPTKGQVLMVCLSNQNADPKESHQINLKGKSYQWVGPYIIFKS